MNLTRPQNRKVWLWWVAAISLSIGISVFIMLQPSVDPNVQQAGSGVLFSSLFVAGLCLIIGTSNRWLGKHL
jgi:hypothetical protein